MAMGNIARDAQAQAVALLLASQAKVRFEDFFQALFRHAGAFVIHMQDELRTVILDMQMGVLPVLQGVVDQVADAALERQRLARIRRQRTPVLGHSAVAVGRQVRLHQAVEHVIEVHRLDVFVDVGVFHALQRAFDQ